MTMCFGRNASCLHCGQDSATARAQVDLDQLGHYSHASPLAQWGKILPSIRLEVTTPRVENG
ncbi:MAG UNVERIFIED_CONTAM: hypothetical protein LVR29_01290 [Microcystis novacekii LVE1205-3]